MRSLLLVFFITVITKSSGQSFITYKDSANRFSINIPTGWKYGTNKNFPQLLLIAQRTPINQADTSRDNFNINVINTPTKTLDKTFADFVEYLPDAKDYRLISKGDTTFNGMKFKWLIETHKIDDKNPQLHNYDFVTLKDGKTYILTLVTFSYAFETVKPLFDKIASSFTLF